MFGYFLQRTLKSSRHYWVASIAGIAGGIISGFVKSGTESILPPRTPDRPIPPAEVLQSFGIHTDDMIYHYSDHIVNWGISGVHYLFSVVFAVFYCLAVEIFPIVKLWQGLLFGVLVTLAFHGVVLPLGGWAPAIWNLPFDELFSESVGHLLWAWTIEIFRHDLRNRMIKASAG
ncbi:DUF1440 domain-containing protein [uncultured Bartonella sp.]|uniref:YagU family protein n=1 Tax=uncultured Bartonella sp. TaxID=104108 RepID=UPI00261E42E4|nr:DUF1440 domain-containing protein [uncultured Bartonella sp.]